MLITVCYLAGCGQRGPLTLPVRESEPAAAPEAEPVEPVEEEDEPEPAEIESDGRDAG